MRLLQKSLLYIIISIVFFDLLAQLSDVIYAFNDSSASTIQMLHLLSLPLAFAIGCLIANYNLFKHSKLVSIILCCYFVAMLIGSYLYIADLKLLSGLRLIHGYFLSLIFCKSFSMLNYLTPRLSFRESFRKYGLFLSAATILLISTSSLITEVFGIQWSHLISMFLYFFSGTLMLLLFNYFKETGKMKSRITFFDYKMTIKASKISIHFITIFLTMLSIGSLLYWTVITPSKSESLFLSKHILLSSMLIASCLVFLTKLSRITESISYIKIFTAGFLLIALSLCTIAILDGFMLMHLPYLIMGLGLGILISGTYHSLKEATSYPIDDIAFGIFHSSMVAGLISGIVVSSAISIYRHSSIIFASLIIISCSIFYIRQMQHSDSSFTISG